MSSRADTLIWITLIALGLTVSASAKKPTKIEKDKDAPPTMNVQVNDAAVRSAPSFLSEVASTLSYGEPVGVLEEAEGWMRIETQGPAVAGWMHASALTKTRIKLEAGESDVNVQASQEELTAGGRGFNQEIEDKFREENEELEASYKLLDRLIKDPAGRASLGQMIRFMREGKLKDRLGGAQ
jgi:SH3-like domain-containing protein